MWHMPRNREEWIVAVVSALVGFFAGGALVALVQKLMKSWFGIG